MRCRRASVGMALACAKWIRCCRCADVRKDCCRWFLNLDAKLGSWMRFHRDGSMTVSLPPFSSNFETKRTALRRYSREWKYDWGSATCSLCEYAAPAWLWLAASSGANSLGGPLCCEQNDRWTHG